MKIAVYGDSHADYHLDKSINPDVSWLEILSDHYNITSFAQGGSGMYYSYKMFLESYKDFDRVIFFATGNDRLFLDNLRPPLNHITSLQMAERYLTRNDLSELEKKFLKAMIDYYTYIFNSEQSDIYRDLMINDVQSRCHDVMLFDLKKFYSNESEIKYYGHDHATVFHEYFDIRHCHFSQEKHMVLADMFRTNLETNSNNIDYSKIHNTNPSKSFDEYFVKYNSERYNNIDYGNFTTSSREILKRKNYEQTTI